MSGHEVAHGPGEGTMSILLGTLIMIPVAFAVAGYQLVAK